jgi:hypothetical protein
MNASHILVGGLTAISIGLLVWIEIRSRRNSATEEQAPVDAELPLPDLQPGPTNKSRGRRGA